MNHSIIRMLPVRAYDKTDYLQRRSLRVLIGDKQIAYLRWGEPAAGGAPRWWLLNSTSNDIALGTTVEEAVENLLKGNGYLGDGTA